MIDLIIILPFFEIINIALVIIDYNKLFIIISILSFVIILLACWGRNKILERHIDLVKKQISFYQQFKLDDLEQKLKKL